MRQLLTCSRCSRAAFIDLNLPADLCQTCLKALGFRPDRLTEPDIARLDHAAFLVGVDQISWEEAINGSGRDRHPEEANHA